MDDGCRKYKIKSGKNFIGQKKSDYLHTFLPFRLNVVVEFFLFFLPRKNDILFFFFFFFFSFIFTHTL